MKQAVFEHAGISFKVFYETDPDGLHRFESVRMLDEQYRPHGPELVPFLNSIMVMTKPEPNAEAAMFLSAIAEEID